MKQVFNFLLLSSLSLLCYSSCIEGKVKGGDFNTDKYVEGSFSAKLCQ